MRVLLSLVVTLSLLFGLVAGQRDCRDVSGTYTYDEEILFSATTNYYAQSLVDGDDFILTLSSSHEGFMGFGIPEQNSGSMLGADIVSVGFESDGIRVADYYVEYEAFPFSPYASSVDRGPGYDPVSTVGSTLFPRRDCTNGGTDDWVLVAASTDVENGEICQQVTIRRKLVTTDVNDREIVSGTEMRVIWAYGYTTEPTYHGVLRGGTRMAIGTLATPSASFECNPPECFYRDFRFENHEILPYETSYVNQDFKILLDNESGVDWHMVHFEELTDPANQEYVHHLVLGGCYGQSLDKDLNFTHEYYQVIGNTYIRNPECNSNVYVWAVGGEALTMPDEAGFPAGDMREDQILYLTLNFHYTNPSQTTGILDNSGVRVYFTTVLRPHDAGILQLGGVGNSVIPAQSEPFITQSTCQSQCTEWMPILNVFASFLHMHSFGQTIWSTQYDSLGNVKRTTNRIDFWNFEWQKVTLVDYQIQPGDSFQTICKFNTSKWNTDITFGLSSYDEMCIEYLFYWPVIAETGASLQCGRNDFTPGTPGRCIVNTTSGLMFNNSMYQVELSPGDPGFELEPEFAPGQAAAECLSTLQSITPTGDGPARGLPIEVIIGVASSAGILLVAAAVLLVLRRRKAAKSDLAAL